MAEGKRPTYAAIAQVNGHKFSKMRKENKIDQSWLLCVVIIIIIIVCVQLEVTRSLFINTYLSLLSALYVTVTRQALKVFGTRNDSLCWF